MLLKTLLISLLAAVPLSAEAPLNRLAPYPAAGFRPDKVFSLPTHNYLPPNKFAAQQQQQRPQKYDVQINQERIELVGQSQSNSLVPNKQPQQAYLPPRNPPSDFLSAQRLPQRRPNPDRQPIRFPPTQPNIQEQHLPAVQQQKPFAKPASEYGAPRDENNEPFTINYPEPRGNSEIEDSDLEDVKRTAIEALNAAIEAHNRKQEANAEEEAGDGGYPAVETDAVPGKKGQYYVLGPDNRLQLVKFTTSQNEEEARKDGFTAHLKYTTVGEINDPVFKHNSRGQLVRVFKK